MIKLKYFDSIRHLLRSGKVDDPYVLKFTKGKVINGKTILDEIPDAMYKVRVTGYIEITKEEYYKTKNIPSNKFYVEYDNGVIYFNPSENGKILDIEYKGRGVLQFPAERIYVHSPNPWAVDNLQEFIDLIYEKTQNIIDIANTFTNYVTTKTQEFIDFVDTKTTETLNFIERKKTEYIDYMTNYLDTKTQEYMDYVNLRTDEITTKVDDFIIFVTNKIDEFSNTLNDIKTRALNDMQQKIDNFTVYIDSKTRYINDKVDGFIDYLNDKTKQYVAYINTRSKYIENWIDTADSTLDTMNGKLVEVDDKIDEVNTVVDEADNKINEMDLQINESKLVTEEAKVNSNLSVVKWQPYVDTYGDIAIKYPVPQNGWTTVAKDTNKIYRYNQYTGNWEEKRSLEEIFTPSTAYHNGLMSKEDYNKLQTIQPNAQVNYTGEDAKNALPEYVHTKTIVIGEKGLINTGIIGIPVQFPYNGKITSIKAFATTPSDDYVELTINKISETEFLTNGMWVDILANHLIINAGNRNNNLNIVYNTDLVKAGDYFKVNVLHSNGTLQDLVVQIDIVY